MLTPRKGLKGTADLPRNLRKSQEDHDVLSTTSSWQRPVKVPQKQQERNTRDHQERGFSGTMNNKPGKLFLDIQSKKKCFYIWNTEFLSGFSAKYL
jgi:hypothetical protein